MSHISSIIYLLYALNMGNLFDLTQVPTLHVVKIEPYSFANGGCADLWKGKRKEEFHDNFEMVHTVFFRLIQVL
jgi:hypothetical protein